MLYRQFCCWADTTTLLTLYLTCIRPHLEYACTLIGTNCYISSTPHLMPPWSNFQVYMALCHSCWPMASCINALLHTYTDSTSTLSLIQGHCCLEIYAFIKQQYGFILLAETHIMVYICEKINTNSVRYHEPQLYLIIVMTTLY